MTVEELEREISELPAAELSRFANWFDQFRADHWDQRIEQDMLSG
jgi:hypothetical protein